MASTLSEFESKQILAAAGIPVPPERLVSTPEEAARAAEALGFPAVLKLCGPGIAHKSERDLVRLGLNDPSEVRRQAADLLRRRGPDESGARLLVASMIPGRRELIAGLVRDPQFGPCVMLGPGGVFAEILGEAAFAVAPLEPLDAEDLIEALGCDRLLGAFRGEPPADRAALAGILRALGRLGAERPGILSIDVNPLILSGSRPVVADALVEVEEDPA